MPRKMFTTMHRIVTKVYAWLRVQNVDLWNGLSRLTLGGWVPPADLHTQCAAALLAQPDQEAAFAELTNVEQSLAERLAFLHMQLRQEACG